MKINNKAGMSCRIKKIDFGAIPIPVWRKGGKAETMRILFAVKIRYFAPLPEADSPAEVNR